MRRFLAFATLAVGLSLSIAHVTGAQPSATPRAAADDNDFIFCQLDDDRGKVSYFSDVFLGDYQRSVRYENAFRDYVNGNINRVSGIAQCFFEKERPRARAKADGMRSRKRDVGYRIHNTDWSY